MGSIPDSSHHNQRGYPDPLTFYFLLLKLCERVLQKGEVAVKLKIALGLIGSVILLVAQFSAPVKVPVLAGTEGYIYNGIESVLILLIITIASFVFTLSRRFKLLRITGIIALSSAAFFYIYAITALTSIRNNIESVMIVETEMPAELALLVVRQPAEILFGEVLIVSGAIIIIIASLIQTKSGSKIP